MDNGVDVSAPLYRVGLLNIIAFNSLCSGLSHYERYPFNSNPDMTACVCPELQEFTSESGYNFDTKSGVVDVGQGFPKSVIKGLGEGFWRRPAVKSFLRLCPRWQDRDVFVAWRWDEDNLRAIEREVLRKMNT